MRYIEINSVRANMVAHPRKYRWSSYRANGEGRDDAVVTQHSVYRALGRSDEQRKEAYRVLFKAQLDEDVLKQVRAAWHTGTPLGNDHFREQVEAKLKTKVGQSRRGRPSKTGKGF
jgi:putative transposase